MKPRLIGSLAALFFALVVAISALDWAWLKAPLELAATRALGRAVTVEGRLSVDLLPVPVAHAEAVTIKGLGKLDRLDIMLAPIALLSGKVEPRETRLRAARLGPLADLEALLGHDGELRASARLPFPGQDGRLTVEAHLDGAVISGHLRLAVAEGGAEGGFTLSGGGLSLPALLLSWGQWRGSLTLETGTPGPSVPVRAQLSASAFGLGLAGLGEDGQFTITGARLRLADGTMAEFSGRLALGNNGLEISPLRLSSSGHSITGALTVGLAPKLPVNGGLTIDTLPLTVDGHLDPAAGQFTGRLATPVLLIQGLRLEAVDARLTARPGEVAVSSLNARLLGGALSAAGNWTPSGLGIGARLTGADLAQLNLGAGGIKLRRGLMDGEARLTARGNGWDDWRNSLDGQGRFSAQDGVVEGFDLRAMDKRLGQPQGLSSLLGAVQAGLGGGQTRFSSLTSSFTAKSGVVTAPDITLAAEGGKGDGHAVFDLPRDRVDARFSLKADTEGAPPLGLRVHGPSGATTKAADINALQHWLAERGMGKTTEGRSGGLVDSLIGLKRR